MVRPCPQRVLAPIEEQALEDVLIRGAERALAIASQTLELVRPRMGIALIG